MYEKLQGIVLNTVRYSDRTSIAHLYTDGHGLMSFAVPQGTGREARRRAALLMPLSLVSVEARVLPHREVCTMREVRLAVPLSTLYGDPYKNAVAMFLSELLTRVIQEPERNDALFSYIWQAVLRLESSEGAAVGNFHLCFLYHLGTHLGIQPDIATWREGSWFDMTDGVFDSGSSNGHPHLQPAEAQVLHLLSRMTWDNMAHFQFNRDQRNRALEVMISYYQLHHAALGTMRSPAVLQQLFV